MNTFDSIENISDNLKYNEDDSLETYYLILEKEEVIFDDTIDFDNLTKQKDSDINLILEDKVVVNKYFKEILKYLKVYSFIEFNYFQLKVIYTKIGVSKNHITNSKYIRIVTKPVMIEDTKLIVDLKRNKPFKIFKDLLNNSDDKKKLKNNISNIQFYFNKYDLIIKCLVRLNYKLSDKFGIFTSCICVKDITSNDFNMLNNNYIELINLLRIIYHIVPICY
jgi:hypothetical protein